MTSLAPTPARPIEQLVRLAATSLGHLGARPHGLTTRALDGLPSRVAPREGLRRRRLYGGEWHLDLADNLQRTLYFTGSYEPRCVSEMLDALRRDDVVVDVGANIGAITVPVALRLKRLGGGRIVAVEPQSAVREMLQAHVEMAGVADIVTIADVGFSDEDRRYERRASQGFGPRDVGTAGIGRDGDVIEAIDVVRGDRWLSARGLACIDVLKIDVEGHEAEVLKGLWAMIAGRAPRYLQVEVVPHHHDATRRRRNEIFSALEALRMNTFWVRSRGVQVARVDDGVSGNLVARASDP